MEVENYVCMNFIQINMFCRIAICIDLIFATMYESRAKEHLAAVASIVFVEVTYTMYYLVTSRL